MRVTRHRFAPAFGWVRHCSLSEISAPACPRSAIDGNSCKALYGWNGAPRRVFGWGGGRGRGSGWTATAQVWGADAVCCWHFARFTADVAVRTVILVSKGGYSTVRFADGGRTYDLVVRLTLRDRLGGYLRHQGPLLPWRPCNERGCWNPMSNPVVSSDRGGKCELCNERIASKRSSGDIDE